MKLKPGISTTEFYITGLCILVSGAITMIGMIDAVWTVGAITVLGGLYTVARMGLKGNQQRLEIAKEEAKKATDAPPAP